MAWFHRWRSARRKECPACGATLMPTTIPEAHGRFGTATITLKELPVLACGANRLHPNRYFHADFGCEFIDQLFCSGEVPISRSRGPFQVCCKCHASVKGPTISSLPVSGQVRAQQVHVFQVDLEAPGTMCATCGERQVYADRDISNDISEAILEAFKAASLEREW